MAKFYFPTYNGVSQFEGKLVTTSIVDRQGNKRIGSEPTKNKVIFLDIIFLRGLQFFIFGLIALISAFKRGESLQFSKQESTKFDKISQKMNIATGYLQLTTTLIVAFILSFIFLFFLPNKLIALISNEWTSEFVYGALLAAMRIAIVYGFFVLLRFFPLIQDLYKFNGACNEAMNNQVNAAPNKKSHHYPLNYLNYLVFTLCIASFVVSLWQISANFWLNSLFKLGLFLACIALTYEILWLVNLCKVKWIRDFIMITSPLVSVRPSLTQEEIIRTLILEHQYFKKESVKLKENEMAMSALMSEIQTKLMAQERYDKSDVEWIIATILNKNREEAKLVRTVSLKEARDILRAADRRAKGEPLSSIFGFVDFYGYKIDINKKVLSPRMETEILVEQTLKCANEFKKPIICDLCTGSGAIAIVLAKKLEAKIYALDISKPALMTAEQNAKKHDAKIDFVQSDLFSSLKKSKKFDIIVSNPPYIPTKEIEKLSIEVKKYDPKLALDGGEDGMDFYLRICKESMQRLNSEGYLLLEVGQGQAAEVKSILKDNGFIDIKVLKDYNGIERVVYGRTSN